MQYQFAPWRKGYMEGVRTPGCFLCQGAKADPATWPAIHVLHRDEERLVILNRFPYNTGHLLIAPTAHVATPVDTSPALSESLARALRAGLEILQKSYKPQGLNAGLNLGNAAGAGVTDHFHWHLLPRWNGDSNFIGALTDTRLLNETLDESYARLRPLFSSHPEFTE